MDGDWDKEPKETAVKIALAATYNPDILKDKISRLHFIKQAFFSMVCIVKWSIAILSFRIFSNLKNEMESLLCLVWDSYELFTLQISKCPS